MRTIENSMIEVEVSPVAFTLDTTGARFQGFDVTEFTGSFILPFEAHWGGVCLPAGEYILFYGFQVCGAYFVKVFGKVKDSAQGVIFIQEHKPASATRNALICIREGDSHVISTLEMPMIDKSVTFASAPG
ncbi:MAG: hypothetical protein P8Z30_11170 [Acidobacteriota bacterium]